MWWGNMTGGPQFPPQGGHGGYGGPNPFAAMGGPQLDSGYQDQMNSLRASMGQQGPQQWGGPPMRTWADAPMDSYMGAMATQGPGSLGQGFNQPSWSNAPVPGYMNQMDPAALSGLAGSAQEAYGAYQNAMSNAGQGGSTNQRLDVGAGWQQPTSGFNGPQGGQYSPQGGVGSRDNSAPGASNAPMQNANSPGPQNNWGGVGQSAYAIYQQQQGNRPTASVPDAGVNQAPGGPTLQQRPMQNPQQSGNVQQVTSGQRPQAWGAAAGRPMQYQGPKTGPQGGNTQRPMQPAPQPQRPQPRVGYGSTEMQRGLPSSQRKLVGNAAWGGNRPSRPAPQQPAPSAPSGPASGPGARPAGGGMQTGGGFQAPKPAGGFQAARPRPEPGMKTGNAPSNEQRWGRPMNSYR